MDQDVRKKLENAATFAKLITLIGVVLIIISYALRTEAMMYF